MGATPLTLVSLILWTLFSSARGDLGKGCQLNCCPSDTFCCGSFCAPLGSREPFTCVSLPDGCCNNSANICAPPSTPPATPSTPASSSNDALSSDGPARISTDAVVSDAAPDDSDTPAAAPTGVQCRPDCCVSGNFCCGRTCRKESLQPLLTCPATSECCSNRQLICSGPTSTPPPQITPTPAPASSITAPDPVHIESAPSTAQAADILTPIADANDPSTVAGSDSEAAQPAPSPASLARTSDVCDDGCEPWWANCGGAKYTGPGCCAAGSSCKQRNSDFQICEPDISSPLCSGGPPEGAGAFCQCGGGMFLGELECGAGLMCVEVNAFYSQCRPVCSLRASRQRPRRERGG